MLREGKYERLPIKKNLKEMRFNINELVCSCKEMCTHWVYRKMQMSLRQVDMLACFGANKVFPVLHSTHRWYIEGWFLSPSNGTSAGSSCRKRKVERVMPEDRVTSLLLKKCYVYLLVKNDERVEVDVTHTE